MKCQTFGAFFLAFALPTLAANLEQPAAEIAEAPDAAAAAVQGQSQDLERRIAPAIPVLASLFGGLLASKPRGKRDLDTADHDLERRIAPAIPVLASLFGGLLASKPRGKRDLDGSNDAEAVLAELAEAIERESHNLDRRALENWGAVGPAITRPGRTTRYRLGSRPRSLDVADADADADAHLERRILPFVSLFKKIMGKRDLESSDADTEAALAELADIVTAADEAEAEAGSDDAAALERRRFRLGNLLPIIPSILPFGGQKVRRDLDTAGADADAHLERRVLPFLMFKKFLGGRDLESSADTEADAHLDRRLLAPFMMFKKFLGGRDLESSANTEAALAELADIMAAAEEAEAEAGSDDAAALERRRFRLGNLLPIIPSILPFGGQKVRRDLDTAGADADAHLERRVLPFLMFKKFLGGRDLEGGSDADTEAAIAELAAALGAEGEDHAALQRRIAPAIPILTTLLGGIFASKPKGKRDLDTADHDLERRIAPAIPVLATLFGGLLASKPKGKRDVDEADLDAALAELASMAEADPSLLGRDVATADQTTSSHLSSADLADVMAPVLEQAAAAEAEAEAEAEAGTEKRDEAISRMRVARGIVV